MNIDKRLEAMRERVERSRPCRMTVTTADGKVVITDPVGAIQLFHDLGPFGAIASVKADRLEYDGLAGMLTAVCHPAPNRRIEDYE